MLKAVIFDMYETLITLYGSPVYFSRQMAEDAGISEDVFTPMKNTTVRVKVYTQTAEQYKERVSHD